MPGLMSGYFFIIDTQDYMMADLPGKGAGRIGEKEINPGRGKSAMLFSIDITSNRHMFRIIPDLPVSFQE